MAYSKKQLAGFAAEYDKIRRNYLRRTRDWLEKGYTIEDFEKPKTSKQLAKEGTKVTKSTIKALKNEAETIKSKTTHEYTDTETGQTIQLPLKEYQRKQRSEAGKRGYETYKSRKESENKEPDERIPNRTNDNTDYGFDDEPAQQDEAILNQVREYIDALKNFSSSAIKVSQRERNEEFEHQLGEKLEQIFDEVMSTDYYGLVSRCNEHAVELEFLFTSAMYAYKEMNYGDRTIEAIIEIFRGEPMSVSEAKTIDTGIDYEAYELEDWEDELPW